MRETLNIEMGIIRIRYTREVKGMKKEKLLRDFQDEAFKTGDMSQYMDLCRLESVLDYMDDDQFIHYLGRIHYKGC